VAEGAGDEVHPVAGGRRPMALKLCTRMGSVRHKSVAKAVAGEGGGSHREWRWWHTEPATGKTRNAAGSELLTKDDGFEGHGGASAHPLDCSLEDGRERSGPTLVSSRSSQQCRWESVCMGRGKGKKKPTTPWSPYSGEEAGWVSRALARAAWQ
jgi:hypothetical protein